MKHGTRDDGMESGADPARHQCRAMNSHHMELKILIVIYAVSCVTGQ